MTNDVCIVYASIWYLHIRTKVFNKKRRKKRGVTAHEIKKLVGLSPWRIHAGLDILLFNNWVKCYRSRRKRKVFWRLA